MSGDDAAYDELNREITKFLKDVVGQANGAPPDDLGALEPIPVRPKEFWEIDQMEARLEEFGDGYETKPSGVKAEDFSQANFQDVYDDIVLASDMIAPDYPQVWADISAAIVDATQTIKQMLIELGNDEGGWKGETRNGAVGSLNSFFEEPMKAAEGAHVMGILVDDFENTILTTKDNIVPKKPDYDEMLQTVEDRPDVYEDIKNDFDNFAQKVMAEVYVPNIDRIGQDNPVFTLGEALAAPELDPGLVDPNSPGGDGAGSFDPGSLDGPGPFAGTEKPDFTGPVVPDLTDTRQAVPTTPIANPSGLNSPTDAIKAATDAARNGLGSAADAAKQAADSARKPFGSGPGDPPEGVLGLGPKGLGDSPLGGGAGGKTGAGAGTRLPRSLADGRPTGAAVTSSTRLPSTAGATGAGPGMMGPPGSGAPAGAPRGGDNNNSHQVLKALRRKKNGQEVAGEGDAVVAVLGATQKPAKPKADQTDQTDPPGTDVRPVPRSTHRSEQATQVLNP